MNKTLQKLQDEQARWSARNFGDQPSTNPLLGLIEEVGELAHAVLKREQNIRLDERLDDKLKDAVGDICIYAADYATREGFSLAESFSTLSGFSDMTNFRDDAGTKEYVFSIALSVGRLCKYHSARNCLSKEEVMHLKASYMGALLVQLERLARLENLTLDKVIMDVWGEVKKRDWKKYPQTGKAA